MQQLIINIWKIMIKIKNRHILNIGMQIILWLGNFAKLPVNAFEWVEDISEFDESFVKSYNEKGNEGYFFEVDIQHPENLHNLYNDLIFLSERMKIGNMEKLVANLYDKTEYVIHIRNLKQDLNHRLVSHLSTWKLI